MLSYISSKNNLLLNNSYSLLFTFISAFIPLFTIINAQAAEGSDITKNLKGNQVYFSITESEQINNDIVSIGFRKQAQASTAQAVTQKINLAMADTVTLLKKHPNITTQISQYNIHPVYNKQRVIRHWMGSQALTITFKNQAKQLSALTEVQALLTYQSMQFSVSATNRQVALDKLTLKAIQRFQNQADVIAQSFHHTKYKILETHINMPTPSLFRANPPNARLMMTAAISAPTVEAGKSQLQVQISGILLLPY